MEDTLKNLQQIHTQLDQLKDDKTKYIKPSDIDPILATLRTEVAKTAETETDATESQQVLKSKVENEVEDLFELVSLFFLLLGRNHETPAQYASSSIVNFSRLFATKEKVYS